jgi:biotin carboxyl carrier protein
VAVGRLELALTLRGRPTVAPPGSPVAQATGPPAPGFLDAPLGGIWQAVVEPGQPLRPGDVVGWLDGRELETKVAGIVARVLIADGVPVVRGTRLLQFRNPGEA